ncbi:MAG: CatB-related O-acetyltransferase, partial [Rikenellaceae bacterium]|nr:CatB-related O-acetyltransferase [Rikenellaceae bacterium]
GLCFPLTHLPRKLRYKKAAGPVTFFPGTKVYDCRFEGYNALRSRVRLSESELGLETYINRESIIQGARIGRWCSIGEGVRIGLGNHPVRRFVSTSGLLLTDTTGTLGFTLHRGPDRCTLYQKVGAHFNVLIGHDVWIGCGVTIMDDLVIGHGAVIGAGAVVTRNVDPYTIVAGVPARPIRKRFNESQIRFLLNLRWWDNSWEWVKAHAMEMEDIEVFMQKRQADESLVENME